MTALNQEKLDWVLRQLETMTAPDRSVDLAIHTLLYPEGDVAKLVQNRHGFDGQEAHQCDIDGGFIPANHAGKPWAYTACRLDAFQ